MDKFLAILLTVLVIAAVAIEASSIRSTRSLRKARQAEDDDEDSGSQEAENKKTTGKPASSGGNKTEKLEPVTIGSFRGYVHRVGSDDVIIIDEKTLEIPDFTYDGEGPASWFVVGSDGDYTTEMVDLPDITVLPDENESCDSLKRYTGQTIRLTLPGKLRVYDISYLSLYCLRFNHNFGYVSIPDDIKVPKAGKNTNKVEECENVEESGSGNRPPPPPQRRPPPSSAGQRPQGSGSVLGGLLNLLG